MVAVRQLLMSPVFCQVRNLVADSASRHNGKRKGITQGQLTHSLFGINCYSDFHEFRALDCIKVYFDRGAEFPKRIGFCAASHLSLGSFVDSALCHATELLLVVEVCVPQNVRIAVCWPSGMRWA